MKRLKYNCDNLDLVQKKEVYDFFIKVAGEKNLILERHIYRSSRSINLKTFSHSIKTDV